MTDALRVPDLPIWESCPFRDKLASRYEVRMGVLGGQAFAVVWDPEHRTWAAGPKRDWRDAELEGVMNNLAGVTLVQLYGHDGYTGILAAKKIAPDALSAEALARVEKFNLLYSWGAASPASQT